MILVLIPANADASDKARGQNFGLRLLHPYLVYMPGPEVIKIFFMLKNSEYDQEIPQSQTADNPVAPRGRAAQPSRDTRLSKAISSLFPIKMIAILEWT